MNRRKFGIVAKSLDGTSTNLTLIDTVNYNSKTYFLFVDLDDSKSKENGKYAVRFLEFADTNDPKENPYTNTFSQVMDEHLLKKLGEAYAEKRGMLARVNVVKGPEDEDNNEDEEDEDNIIFHYVFENEDGEDEEFTFLAAAVIALDGVEYVGAVCLDDIEPDEDDDPYDIYFFEILDSNESEEEPLLQYVEDDGLYDELFELFSEQYGEEEE